MAETKAVAIKLSTFWAQQPEVWFLQAEAHFHIRMITDATTKYYHVLAALDQETSSRVLDMLSAPPADKYTDLKQKLLTTFGLSKREQVSKHLLGDRKPSELMDEMLSLLTDHGFVSWLSSYFSSRYLKISVCRYQTMISLIHKI